jgi:hypothetical protein
MSKNWISGKRDEKEIVIRPSKRENRESGSLEKLKSLYVTKIDEGYLLEDGTGDCLIITFSQAKKLAEKMVKDLTGVGASLKVGQYH